MNLDKLYEDIRTVLNESKNYYKIGGDAYDGGVVVQVYVNGKKVADTIRDGEEDYKYKNKNYKNIADYLDAIAKDYPGVSNSKSFKRVELK